MSIIRLNVVSLTVNGCQVVLMLLFHENIFYYFGKLKLINFYVIWRTSSASFILSWSRCWIVTFWTNNIGNYWRIIIRLPKKSIYSNRRRIPHRLFRALWMYRAESTRVRGARVPLARGAGVSVQGLCPMGPLAQTHSAELLSPRCSVY